MFEYQQRKANSLKSKRPSWDVIMCLKVASDQALQMGMTLDYHALRARPSLYSLHATELARRQHMRRKDPCHWKKAKTCSCAYTLPRLIAVQGFPNFAIAALLTNR